ncbi:hypothetical protein BH24DEI2_BH24DEI2_07600 [soil metagenome]
MDFDLGRMSSEEKQRLRNAIDAARSRGAWSSQRDRHVQAFELCYLDGLTFEKAAEHISALDHGRPVTRQRVGQLRDSGEKLLRTVLEDSRDDQP